MFECIQFYHYIKEAKDVLKSIGSSEKCFQKRKQSPAKTATVSSLLSAAHSGVSLQNLASDMIPPIH